MPYPVTINGNTYSEVNFLNRDYVTTLPDMVGDVATVAGQVSTNASTATAQAGIATTQAGLATTAKNDAQTARDAAVAAAASATFPFGETAGTSTAYTLDLTPDQVTGAGSAFRVQFHTANGDNPTLAVDGGTAAEIVTQGGQSLDAGDIATDRIYIVIYDAALTKWVINVFMDRRKTELIRAKGPVAEELSIVFIADRARRLHGINHILGTDTCTIAMKKNGTDIGGLASVSVDTSFTNTAVNDSSNAYIDFAIGDKLEIEPSSAGSAEDLYVYIDIEDL